MKQEDAGLFSCTVGNADGFVKHQVMLRIIQGKKKKKIRKTNPQISVKTSNRVNVTDARNISTSFFTVSLSPSVPLWEGQFSISCSVTPRAQGATIQWTLNNSSSIGAIEMSQTTSASTVRGVASTSQAGTWSCVVGYKGQVGRASASLTIKGRTSKAVA